MSDDPKKEPSKAPQGIVFSGAAAVTAGGTIGLTTEIVLSGAAALSAAGELIGRAETVTSVVSLRSTAVIIPGEQTDEVR